MATPRKKAKDKKKTGRKSSYDEKKTPLLVFNLCKEFGAIDKQIAKTLNISVATLNKWKIKYPEFIESLKSGKDQFDSNSVENALRKRALGYEYIEKHEGISKVDGIATVSKKQVTKEVAASVTAQMYWLQNRNPERWKNTKYMGTADFGQDIDWEEAMSKFGEAIEGKFIDKPE
jgi:hypothetical protein